MQLIIRLFRFQTGMSHKFKAALLTFGRKKRGRHGFLKLTASDRYELKHSFIYYLFHVLKQSTNPSVDPNYTGKVGLNYPGALNAVKKTQKIDTCFAEAES